MARYRAVFFDAGGTLIHIDLAYVSRGLVGHRVPRDEAIRSAARIAVSGRVSTARRSDAPGDDADPGEAADRGAGADRPRIGARTERRSWLAAATAA